MITRSRYCLVHCKSQLASKRRERGRTRRRRKIEIEMKSISGKQDIIGNFIKWNSLIIIFNCLLFGFILIGFNEASERSEPSSRFNLSNFHDIVRNQNNKPENNNNNNNNNINNNNINNKKLPHLPNYVKLDSNSTIRPKTPKSFNYDYSHNANHFISLDNNKQLLMNQSSSDLISLRGDSNININININKQKRTYFEKICIGTSNRMSGQHNKTDHYQNLAERYRNCTYVIGNLEITWLEKSVDGKAIDLSFLESIREITGYLLIGYVEVEKIRMPNLQIIRGRDLFKLNKPDHKEEFAMFLIENELKTLELPNLREILAGSVGFYDNKNLCHMRTINWDEILNPTYKTRYLYNSTREPDCQPCDSSCQGACWGEGPEMCQKFSKVNCSPQCSQGRCFGNLPRECCHLFCAGGCTGPKQTDCFACKNFYDDGECIQECPSMQKYNPSKFLWETDPKGKYAFGATCVKECPEHLLRDNGACVRTCPPNKRSVDGECIPCGGPCPKNCQGVDVVHSGNIDQFINCTQIEGSLTILDSTFSGYAEVYNNTIGQRYEPMHPSRLNVFKTLREITGYLSIQASHPEFKNLSCFKNLKTIGGRQATDLFYALSIIKTSLVSLGLQSLRKVRSGKITIEENKDLCFADTMDWTKINMTTLDSITIRNNADSKECRRLGLICHNQCAKHGCWGPGPDECLACINYKLDDFCVDNCTSTHSIGLLSFDDGNKTCKRCNQECKGGCRGPGARHCFQCKNVSDGPYCVAECPSHKYNRNGICEECDKSCVDGCTGPSNMLGPGGCNSCGKAVLNSTNPFIAHCIKSDEPCPEGYYQEYVGPQAEGPLKSSSGKLLCRKCHHRCKACTGMGTHVSVCECAKYVVGEQCEDSCPRDYYADEQLRQCTKCSSECNGCFGPTEADCNACRVYRIYADSYAPVAVAQQLVIDKTGSNLIESSKQAAKFNCTSQCPQDKPHRVSDSNILDPYCSEYPGNDPDNPRIVSMSSISVILFLIVIGAVTICIAVYRCQIEKDKTVKLTMRLSGFDDAEPLNQSNVKPNLAPLRSIKETELRIGKIMGSGSGGRVYQGAWLREDQADKTPQPVAIKVLHNNGQSNMNKEFLDEAYMMASVNHPNLVQLLAVCMTPKQLMLVTPLMPLGCLLDHVRKKKNDIGSKNLLEWCKQIAKGMAYLEDRRMVHRDLALRNVLLHVCGRALISDFGLAKFLDVDQSEYHAGGGKLPIRWLAPECIRERKFTHKSDVYAFGVTIWELLTLGKIPYEQYETKDVPSQFERGYRLPQPPHVSVEVYKLMLECWCYNPEGRPNFKSLAQNFVNFARDPERYLAYSSKNRQNMECNSNSDENVFDDYGSEMNFADEDNQTRPIFSDFTNNHGRLNEAFGLELRHHSETESQQVSTPTAKKMGLLHNSRQQLIEEEMMNSNIDHADSKTSTTLISDLNNNNNNFITNGCLTQADSCWSSHQTVSSSSIGRRSEQPTDVDDYLIPSPLSNEDKFTKFLACHGGANSRQLPAGPSFNRDPPHSAGLIGISNDEYFLTQVNYANPNGPHCFASASSGPIPHYSASASSDRIPTSLV